MRKLLSQMRKLIFEQNLIENGDKIAVGVSGGKDSLTMLTALKELQKYSEINFDLVAIAVDLSNGKMDYERVKNYCESLNIEFFLINSNVFEIIFEIRKEKNPCSLCAKLRRGLLNNAAKNLGCNKVALAHHCDDLVETFLLGMFFEGRMNILQPKTYLSRTNLTVIRPMLLCEEDEIKKIAKNMPVIHNICPKDHFSERENAKQIIEKLNEIYPNCKQKIMIALTNPQRYNLWK